MCWCRPEIRTPNCGRAECFPHFKDIDEAYKSMGIKTEKPKKLTVDQQIRIAALNAAIGFYNGTVGISSDEIVATAKIFEGYIRGGESSE